MEKCEPTNSVGQRLNVERLCPENIEFYDISGKIADDHVNNLHLIFLFGVTWAIRETVTEVVTKFKRSAILRRATIPRRHLFAKLPHAHKLLTKRIFYCEKDSRVFPSNLAARTHPKAKP